jgi:predicted metal-dependent hydrolase
MSWDEAAFRRGLQDYDGGRYFEAHEAWEVAWRGQPPGADRELLQGLIHVAVALEHHRRGNAIGAAGQLDKARRRLGALGPVARGLDVAAMVASAATEIEGG